MQPATITLRKATAGDIGLLVRMRLMFGEELAGPSDPATEALIRTNLHEYLASELNKSCICWFAVDGDTAVSVVMMVLRWQPGGKRHPSGKWGYLMNVYTLPGYRRRGIANLVLQQTMDDARSLGYTAFELHATKEGEQMYVNNGFNKHGEPTYRKFT